MSRGSRQAAQSLEDLRLDVHPGLLELIQYLRGIGEEAPFLREEKDAQCAADGDGEGNRAITRSEVVEDGFKAGIADSPGEHLAVTASEIPAGNGRINDAGADIHAASGGEPLPGWVRVGARLDFHCDGRWDNQSFCQPRQEQELTDLSEDDEGRSVEDPRPSHASAHLEARLAWFGTERP